jgi:hypothetical protein
VSTVAVAEEFTLVWLLIWTGAWEWACEVIAHAATAAVNEERRGMGSSWPSATIRGICLRMI